MNTDKDTAQTQAVAQVDSICAMVAALECDFDRLQELRDERDAHIEACKAADEARDGDLANHDAWVAAVDARGAWQAENGDELAELEAAAGEWSDRDDVVEAINENALSVEVRAGWASVGELSTTPDEFRIVLCTGGPHVELVGDLDNYCQPSRVRVLYRDWGTSGELFDFDSDAVLTYCQQLYFGE